VTAEHDGLAGLQPRIDAVRAQLAGDMARAVSDPEVVAENWLRRLAAEGAAQPEWWHVLKLAEETGEACRAWLAAEGRSRTSAGEDELARELADVVITAHCVAALRGLDLPAAIGVKHAVLMTRDLGGLRA